MTVAAPLETPKAFPPDPVLTRMLPRVEPPDRQAALSGFAMLCFVVLIAGATWLSINHTRIQGGVATVWVANGILVGVLVLIAQRKWSMVFALSGAATLFTRMYCGDAFPVAISLTAVNLLECAMIAGTIRYFVPDIREPAALLTLAKAAVTSTVVACLVSATIVALLFRLWSDQSSTQIWATWFTAHLLGMVIAATVTVTAMRLKSRVLGRPGHRLDLAACLALLAFTCVAVGYVRPLPLLFLAYVPLMLVVYRHGFAGVVTGILVLIVATGLGAGLELGPFHLMQDRGSGERSVLLQVFIGAACLLTFPTALALVERRRLAGRLEAVANNVPAMIAHFDAMERLTYINATGASALGHTPAELTGKPLRSIRGELAYAELAGEVAAVLAGEAQAFEGNVTIGGRPLDHSTRLIPDWAANGGVRGFYSLSFDITALKEAERQLQRLARFDALTGLPNRRHFDESLELASARAQRNGKGLMLLALDVDKFKHINDAHGHSAGDSVLQAVANRLRECVYEVDLPARVGGDEFAVLVEYTPDATAGAALAERILKAMREPIQAGDLALSVSVSIGIGIVHPVRDREQLLELADAALYEAKSAGRDAWRLRMGGPVT